MDLGTASVTLGAAYGLLQAAAQLVMLIVPKGTIAWNICKALVSGGARPDPLLLAKKPPATGTP